MSRDHRLSLMVWTFCAAGLFSVSSHAGDCYTPIVSALQPYGRATCTDAETGVDAAVWIATYIDHQPYGIGAEQVDFSNSVSYWWIAGYTDDVNGNIIAECQAVDEAPSYFVVNDIVDACADAVTLFGYGYFEF